MSSLNKEMISCGLFGCIEVVGHCGEPFMPPQVGTHSDPALRNALSFGIQLHTLNQTWSGPDAGAGGQGVFLPVRPDSLSFQGLGRELGTHGFCHLVRGISFGVPWAKCPR